MSDETDLDQREAQRASVWVNELGELGHELSTPLNVLVGRLTLIEDVDGPEEVKSHVASMRRQVDRLVKTLRRVRGHLPVDELTSVTPSELETLIHDVLSLDADVRGERPSTACPVLVRGCLRSLADHLGEVDAVTVEERDLEEVPVRYVPPGRFLCIELRRKTKQSAPTELSTRYALPSARGHARRMRAVVLDPTEDGVILCLQLAAA